MKILFILVFCLLAKLANAQFDPDCYYPKIGVEIDTIYGSMNDQELGRGFDTVPRFLGETYTRIGTMGLPERQEEFVSFKTGPGFDINNLQGKETSGGIDPMNYDLHTVRYGHFRSRRYLDMLKSHWTSDFPDTIYWADDSGKYSRERYTTFSSNITVDSGYIGYFEGLTPSYTSLLTSDTVKDLVMGWGVTHVQASKRRYYLLLYKGGASLYAQGKIATPDSILELENGTELFNITQEGDYRGTGREDAIIYKRNKNGFNDIMFYKNEPPFSLFKFYHAMRFDTLMTSWENKVFREYNPGFTGCPIMSAYRRDPSDPTKDFFLSAETTDDRHLSLWLFKGGPDFGSKRLYLDSPTYFFWHPSHYDGNKFMSVMSFFSDSYGMGDMTGTGNSVLCARGILPVGGQTCLWGFYVLGDAMDDKMDMFFTTQKVGWPIPITADNDNMTDAVLGMPFICSEKDDLKGWANVGSIGLLHGSKKIPVHLNDVASDREREHQKTAQMYAYPNPLDQKTTLTFENCTSGVMYMDVVNSIGVSVIREEIPDVDGLQQYAADLSGLPAGAYHIRLVCPADGWSASTSVIKNGGAVAPWKFDLRKMVGR